MKYCKTCLQPNTRPNSVFNADGSCPACTYHKSLKLVDWELRAEELKKVVNFGRENSHSGYDCIIGVSGGKDSLRQALFVKHNLKMNPLLVSLGYPPEQVTQRGVENISNMISHGFDCITINPAPGTWRDLKKKGFRQYTNSFRSTELALFSSVPKFAIAYQIPLIWWGENSALQLGETAIMGKTGSDGNNLRKMNTLNGGDITWLLSDAVSKSQILQYCYPSPEEMEAANLRITFLGYFWKDWSLLNNGIYSALRGLDIRSEKPWEIGDPYGITSLDEDFVTFNQMIKYYKYGFGRITDYVNEEIRNELITRDEGIDLVKRYDGTCSPEYIEKFTSYIGISVEEFWLQVDQAVNPQLFEKVALGDYRPKFEIGIGL